MLTWRPDIYKVGLIQMTEQTITCEVLFILQNLNFQFTIIDAFNTKEEKKGLWKI